MKSTRAMAAVITCATRSRRTGLNWPPYRASAAKGNLARGGPIPASDLKIDEEAPDLDGVTAYDVAHIPTYAVLDRGSGGRRLAPCRAVWREPPLTSTPTDDRTLDGASEDSQSNADTLARDIVRLPDIGGSSNSQASAMPSFGTGDLGIIRLAAHFASRTTFWSVIQTTDHSSAAGMIVRANLAITLGAMRLAVAFSVAGPPGADDVPF